MNVLACRFDVSLDEGNQGLIVSRSFSLTLLTSLIESSQDGPSLSYLGEREIGDARCTILSCYELVSIRFACDVTMTSN